LFGWLAVLFSYINSASATIANQQYFSLTTNQHQPPATSQPNEVEVSGRGKQYETKNRMEWG
jgi:hypothetical protein